MQAEYDTSEWRHLRYLDGGVTSKQFDMTFQQDFKSSYICCNILRLNFLVTLGDYVQEFWATNDNE
jgi:hypothetical protein